MGKEAGEFGQLAECGGGLPVYIEGGKTYYETNAILRMLGARHGFYSTDPDTMWEIDVCMEKIEQVFGHKGVAPHSHYCVGRLQGTSSEEKTTNIVKMYEELCSWADMKLTKHGKKFLAGTEKPTVADFRYIVQFCDSIYNDQESCVLDADMKSRV